MNQYIPIYLYTVYIYFFLLFNKVESCQNAWDGVATIDESVLCADKTGVSICSGDSGGPLGKFELYDFLM